MLSVLNDFIRHVKGKTETAKYKQQIGRSSQKSKTYPVLTTSGTTEAA